MRAGGLEPPRGYPQRIFVPATAFAAPPTRVRASQGSWSGLSLHRAPEERDDLPAIPLCLLLEHDLFRKPVPTPDQARAGFFGIMLQRGLGAARLVSTPSRCRAWLGIAVERFPRVWAVLRPRFPAAHSKRSSPLRLPFRHARVARTAIPAPPGVAKAIPAARSRGAKEGVDKPILSAI